MGERLILELIAGVIALIAALGGLLRLVNYATSRAIRVLEQQVQNEHDDNVKLLRRVSDLEAQRDLDKNTMTTLQNQLTTVLNEMAALQKQVKLLEDNLQASEENNGKLTQERDQFRAKSEALQRALDIAQIRETALRDALALVGGERNVKAEPEHAKEPSETSDVKPVEELTHE